MLNGILWSAYATVRRFRTYGRELDNFSRLPSDAAKNQLGARLLAQLQYFGRRADALPEWREASRVRTVDDLWQIWPSLPILTKRDLQTRFLPSEMQASFGLVGIASMTGGSTGEPTPYFHDVPMLRAAAATRWYCRRQMGWTPGMPTLGVWGSERDIGKTYSRRSRISARFRNEQMVASFGVNEQTVDKVLDFVREHPRAALYGFSSLLEYVARSVVERGEAIHGRVRAAWNGGEMLYPSQVEVFERAFGVPVLNLYGGRELSAMAYQAQSGGSLAVLRPLLMLEIVDEQGRVVQPGESGRLVWTSTICRGTPFMRFDIGDLGCADEQSRDACGIRALTRLDGRHAGLLRLPSGKVINNLFWNHLFKDFPEVQQFQVIAERDEIRVLLKGRGFAADRERNLRSILAKTLETLNFTITWVDHFVLTPQGKLVQVLKRA